MLLDSCFIIDLLRGNKAALNKLAEIEEFPLSTTEINVLELYKGAHLSKKVKENLEAIDKLLESLEILKLEESHYEVFALLSAYLQNVGKSIGDFDEIIATITLNNDETIITRDNHFKNISQLKIMDY